MNAENKQMLKDFVQKIKGYRTPVHDRAYSRYSSRYTNAVRDNFTLEEINELLRRGSPEELRELSRYYYRVSGVYRNTIDLYAGMSRYEYIVTPVFEPGKAPSKTQVIPVFYQACSFADILHIPVNFTHIMRQILLNGVYYGILRKSNKGYTFQDLPIEYCRVRFKDENDLNVLEFNVAYFNIIRDAEYQRVAIDTYPDEIKKAWRRYKRGDLDSQWIELAGGAGGVSFSIGDGTPPLASSIPSIYQMDDAIGREADRDENELYKLLIQKMPIDNKGELVFQLDEVADIHASVAQMLSDTDTVDVLTTFGDTTLESIQDSTAATQSSNRIKKYVETAYDQLGVPELLFNCDTASGLDFAIKRMEAFVREITNLFSVWICYQINKKFAKPKFHFDFEILPTTIFNQEQVQEKYFQGAQYGYSKMYAGVSLGIKQTNQISLMDFENEMLGMTEKMIPLQSTYTSSGKVEKSAPLQKNGGATNSTTTKTTISEKNTEETSTSGDINNSGSSSSSTTTTTTTK